MYFLKCSVCDGEFKTKESWTCHLIDKGHLNEARKKCVRWSPNRKSHVLIAYATFPMSSTLGLSLLQKLSKDLLTFITDFVWREGNSRVGLFQFESSDRLEKVLASLGNPHAPRIEVAGYPVTFRRAIDLVDLEWEALVTPELEADEFSALSTSGEAGEAPKKKKRKINPSEKEESETKFAVSSTISSAVPPVEIKLSKSECEDKKESLDNSCEDNSKENNKRLHKRLSSLLETVRISDSEYNDILGIVNDIKVAFSNPNGRDCTVRVFMFRNLYLQLRNATHNPLLLFVYNEVDSSSNPIVNTFVPTNELVAALKKWGVFQVIQLGRSASNVNEDVCSGDLFLHTQTDIQLRVVTLPLMLTEVQRCRLFKYYLTFYTRMENLIALVYLWSRINKIRIAYNSNEISKFHAHSFIPDPGALEWLLVVFLCQAKIIPTPREIQQRPHNQVCHPSAKFDMGFDEDAEFAKEWSRKFKVHKNTDKFALSVLELAGNFFLFCANLAQQPCIVNTRDAEVLPRDYFLSSIKISQSYSTSGKTKLSPFEVKNLHKELNFKATSQNNISKHINIQHPFNVVWRFSIDDKKFISEVCPMMKSTANRLLHFSKLMKVLHTNKVLSNKIKISTNLDLENLIKC